MFDLSDYVHSYKDIPSHWIFQFYLKLEPLNGQTVMIKSVFNEKDNDPSLAIYYNGDLSDYRYNCFSTGNKGNAMDLVCKMWACDFPTAYRKVKEDYLTNKDLAVNTEITSFSKATWKVEENKVREWNTNDAAYWSPYNIGSRLLDLYKIKPLSEYTMTRTYSEGHNQSFRVVGEHIYGYFTNEGVLYKIYRPFETPKFMKLHNYLQGFEQLQGYENLIIASSLKDIMALLSLGLRADFIAPDSENSIISEVKMKMLLKKYKAIITLFDNDDAGITNMKKYLELYNIPFAYIPMAKDVSDSVKKFGKQKVIYEAVPKINSAFEKFHVINFVELVG